MDSEYTPPEEPVAKSECACAGGCPCQNGDELSFEARTCPSCGMRTIHGMRGSPGSICKNCGYKDPCCYD